MDTLPPTYFVRLGPTGQAYGPFVTWLEAERWAERRGRSAEGWDFKIYEALDPLSANVS